MLEHTSFKALASCMKRGCIISTIFVFATFSDALGVPVTINFNGTFDTFLPGNITSIDGLMPGDLFSGTMIYDFELASSLAAQHITIPNIDISDALNLKINIKGYTAELGGQHGAILWNGSIENPGEGMYFTSTSSSDQIYFEYLRLGFFYNDNVSHDFIPVTAPDPDKFVLSSLDISGGPLFHARGSINDSPSPIPEPSTLFLLGAGLAGVGLLRKRICN